ncbi:hypothetical protein [Sphingobacterium multivorum]|uniref:hypothetical protein n=1 Tax=Sphingobacterium multivorum TaxID=28454 RepID=UPI0021140C60|nr:hypothetical protein [Sphingobacterium multivorum]
MYGRVFGEIRDGYALSDAVLERSRVFITPGGIFGDKGDQYIRISLCATVEVLKESIQRIKIILTHSISGAA